MSENVGKIPGNVKNTASVELAVFEGFSSPSREWVVLVVCLWHRRGDVHDVVTVGVVTRIPITQRCCSTLKKPSFFLDGKHLKQGMRIGGPMSRVAGEPMTSYISRRRRWWTLVHEMDNTQELGDTVQGSMMLEQAGPQPVRAEHGVDVHQQPSCSNSTTTYTIVGVRHPRQQVIHLSPNRWRRRDTTRAYLAEAETHQGID